MTTSRQPLYGRRKGRPLRTRKSALMRELLPRLQIALLERGELDPQKLFTHTPKSLWLEVGFGGGEHLAAQAQRNPSIGFIGCEPFVNGVASLLDHIDRQLKNIRIFPDDARLLIDALPDHSVDRCFVLFADPWPKAKHMERRFIGPRNLPALARVLKKGAELQLATDDARLKAWMKRHMDAAKDFSRTYASEDPPQDWVRTRYEEKALKAGCKPAYFSYIRA